MRIAALWKNSSSADLGGGVCAASISWKNLGSFVVSDIKSASTAELSRGVGCSWDSLDNTVHFRFFAFLVDSVAMVAMVAMVVGSCDVGE